MQKSKLVRTLYRLSLEDFERFGKYIRAIKLFSNSAVLDLFAYLKKYYPHADSNKLSKQKAYLKIFPESATATENDLKFHNKKMRKLMSVLNKFLEEFLIKTELERHPGQKEKLLAEAHTWLGNDHDARLITKRLIEEKEKIRHKTGSDYLEMFQLKSLWFSQLKALKYRSEEESVAQIMLNLDLFYFDSKLKLTSELLNRQKALSADYEIHLQKEIIRTVQNLPAAQQNPLMLINLKMIELLQSAVDIHAFRELRQFFDHHMEALRKEDRLETLQRLVNYTILAYNEGHLPFLNEQLELYKIALEKELILQNRTISDTSFTNIVVLGSILGEYDWTFSFMEKYHQLLDPQVRFDAFELSMAFYSFYRKDYEEVLRRLQNVKKFLPAYGIRIRSLLLRTYFELFLQDSSYQELLEAYFRSFDKYIKNHKNLSKNRKKAYLNFSRMVKLLKEQIINKKAHPEKANLKAILENTSPVIAKIWLLNKIADF